jgi:hypothetical protein
LRQHDDDPGFLSIVIISIRFLDHIPLEILNFRETDISKVPKTCTLNARIFDVGLAVGVVSGNNRWALSTGGHAARVSNQLHLSGVPLMSLMLGLQGAEAFQAIKSCLCRCTQQHQVRAIGGSPCDMVWLMSLRRSCLAVGGHKSSSSGHLVQVAQALPKPSGDSPRAQFACRLDKLEVPTSLSWHDECDTSALLVLDWHLLTVDTRQFTSN